MQLQAIFASQQHFDYSRLNGIACQPVELPQHQGIKLTSSGGGSHFLKATTLQTPPIFGPVSVYTDHDAASLGDGFTANGLLVFQTDFILHLR